SSSATSEIYPLSLHDALPICLVRHRTDRHDLCAVATRRPAYAALEDVIADPDADAGSSGRVCHVRRLQRVAVRPEVVGGSTGCEDRKSTRLNSSHVAISYAVF